MLLDVVLPTGAWYLPRNGKYEHLGFSTDLFYLVSLSDNVSSSNGIMLSGSCSASHVNVLLVM